MEKRIIPFNFKTQDDAQGTFTGDANVTGIVDLGGDRIMPGAFLKDLQQRGPRRPLLWAHDGKEVLGTVDLSEIVTGPRTSLRVTLGQLALGVQRAREAYELLKIPGAIGGLSIGFEGTFHFAKDGIREITEAVVYEVSLVFAPMNQESRVDSVKARDAADLAKSLKTLHRSIRDTRVAAERLSADPVRRAADRFASTLHTLAAKLAA